MVIGHFLSKKPNRCALCKQEHNWKELLVCEGRYVCEGCLRLIREEGIVFPDEAESETENSPR